MMKINLFPEFHEILLPDLFINLILDVVFHVDDLELMLHLIDLTVPVKVVLGIVVLWVILLLFGLFLW